MNSYSLIYNVLVNGVITIDWPAIVDDRILKDLLSFQQRILEKPVDGITEVVNGYHSLWLYTDQKRTGNEIIAELKVVYSEKTNVAFESKLWTIPVCYDRKFAIDMDQLKNTSSLSEAEIVALHTQVTYRIFFIGFLPGFLYLGGLDKKLHLPRKANPDPKISAGSVAIGGNQTGIYPEDSPGGWHIVGKTPVRIFDQASPPYCLVVPGDQVRFRAIDMEEYRAILESVRNKKYELTHE